MTIHIIIPARWGSARLPGKPLQLIAGRPLLSRVIDVARRALRDRHDIEIVVAADDERVAALARESACAVVMTDSALASGSDRALAGALLGAKRPSHIVNLQGDTPLLPPEAITAVVEALLAGASVATPVIRLSWADLDRLRAHKQRSPFSGTTCIVSNRGEARWFSKAVIPAIRDEQNVRTSLPMSPVLQHLGLYGYTMEALERFHRQPVGHYETIEGLEQLRFFDMGILIQTVEIAPPTFLAAGIDTADDVARAEKLIVEYGDPFGG